MLKKILKGIAVLLGIVLLLAVMVIAFFVWRSEPMPEAVFFSHFPSDRPTVFAHQGGDGERPSNTLVSFQNAVDLGVDALELDVHSTSDGVIVVIHDESVDRTTDGTGLVHEMSLAELKALDAGFDWPTLEGHSELNSGNHPYRGQGITIPTLEEVFMAFPNYPSSIEIKQDSPSIAEPLCALIRQYEMQAWVMVGSFSKIATDEFRAACPEIPTIGYEDEIKVYYALNLFYLSATWQPTTHVFAVPEYFGELHVLSPSFIENTNQHNVRVYAWTINTREDMRRMIDLGVDGIITDYPSLAMQVVNE
jgi:glycerophosphoryl diester phosphodiesterase